MPKTLPKGWATTTLGEIAEPSRRRALPARLPGIRYIGLQHVEPHTMRLVGHGYGSDVRSSSTRFSEGDVLYGKLRPYLNKVWVAEFDGLCSAEFLVFSKLEGLNSHFLALRLSAEDFVAFANGQVSGERPRVGFERLSPFPILLPPLPEQQLIVARLSAGLAGIDRARTAVQRAEGRLRRYRAAVRNTAVTGRLTRRWRAAKRKTNQLGGDSGEALLHRLLAAHRERREELELAKRRAARKVPSDTKSKPRYPSPSMPTKAKSEDLPEGWVWVRWEQAGFSQNGRAFRSQEYSHHGVRLLRPGNLYADGSVRWTEKNTRHVPLKTEQQNLDLVVRGNELVINLTAQSLKEEFLGRVCLTSEAEHCLLNQRLARLTPVLGVPKYLLYVFKSSLFRRFVDGLNTGSLIQHMFTSQLREFAIPFPPEGEQAEIVREVDNRLSAADRLATRLQQQLTRTEETRQALLREAFAGDLVPQDAEDEPAAVLLERIRVERKRLETELRDDRRGRHHRSETSMKHATTKDESLTPEALIAGFARIGRKAGRSPSLC